VDEDLAQTLWRVHDVYGTATILLGHGRSLRQSCIRLLSNRGEDLEMVVYAPNLVGDLDQAELGEVPDFRRKFAGHARVDREILQVFVEILINAVDENGERRFDRAQSRH